MSPDFISEQVKHTMLYCFVQKVCRKPLRNYISHM